MDTANKYNLLEKIKDPAMRESLSELMVDLDEAQVKYGPLDTDILELLDDYHDASLSDEQNIEFKKALKNHLKNTNTKIHFDFVVFNVSDESTTGYKKRSHNWVIYPLEKMDLDYTWESIVKIPFPEDEDYLLISTQLALQFGNALNNFENYLKEEFSIPVDYNDATKKKEVYPWHESWLPENMKPGRTNNYSPSIELLWPKHFIQVVLRNNFSDAQKRRKEKYLNAHPELQDLRVQMHLDLVKNEISRTGKTTLNSHIVSKLMRAVDLSLFESYPEYKAACLE